MTISVSVPWLGNPQPDTAQDERALERAEYEGMTDYGRAVDRLIDAE